LVNEKFFLIFQNTWTEQNYLNLWLLTSGQTGLLVVSYPAIYQRVTAVDNH